MFLLIYLIILIIIAIIIFILLLFYHCQYHYNCLIYRIDDVTTSYCDCMLTHGWANPECFSVSYSQSFKHSTKFYKNNSLLSWIFFKTAIHSFILILNPECHKYRKILQTFQEEVDGIEDEYKSTLVGLLITLGVTCLYVIIIVITYGRDFFMMIHRKRQMKKMQKHAVKNVNVHSKAGNVLCLSATFNILNYYLKFRLTLCSVILV